MPGFEKAVREQVWLKVLLTGTAGSGKSYSALRIAKGIASQCGSDIAYIGSEGSRDKYYCNEFDYDLLQIEEPYSTDKYMTAIDDAINSGYKILIIDSISHEWKWLNDTHDKMGGNSFQNWGKLKPQHNQFMDKILASPIHIIATARGKEEWVMDEQNGKSVPRKVGMGAQQDKNVSYEFTVSLVISQDTHVAIADKDNTHLFENKYDILTENDGINLYKWANDGEKPKEKPANQQFEKTIMDEEEMLKAMKKEIISLCTELGGQKNTELMNTLKTFVPSGNPNALKDVSHAKECLEKLKNIKPLEMTDSK